MTNIMPFVDFLKASIDNLRSGISKNALMLTTELFKNRDLMNLQDNQATIVSFVQVLMPSIVHKTVYEKTFIAKEAKTSITNALDTCLFDDML